MNRRQFAVHSLAAAAGATLHLGSSSAATPLSPDEVPGAVPESLIQQARFPEGFLWGNLEEQVVVMAEPEDMLAYL